MAGYREFQTGEVLTSANVNDFLMDQSVMTFADATARDAALTGVLREGLVAYNLDTSALEKYDGSAWGPVADLTNLDADNLTSGTVAAARLPAGTIVDIKSVVLSAPFTVSMTSQSDTEITGLTITHSAQSATNKILLIANVFCTLDFPMAGIAVAIDGTMQQLGDNGTIGSRNRNGSSNYTIGVSGNSLFQNTVTALLSPASTSSKTYSVRAIANRDSTRTLCVNRTSNDTDSNQTPRTASTLMLMEVRA